MVERINNWGRVKLIEHDDGSLFLHGYNINEASFDTIRGVLHLIYQSGWHDGYADAWDDALPSEEMVELTEEEELELDKILGIQR